MLNPSQRRWLTVCVLYFASCLNYLDRNLLSALAPTLLKEYGINGEQFGYVISTRSGWRSGFVFTGLLGFLWMPVWLWVARETPVLRTESVHLASVRNPMMGQLLGIVIANALSMTVYSLWFGWSTLFLVD